MTQKEMIKKHLMDGRSITPIQALNNYGCFRLASRINDLKNEGMIINSVLVSKGEKKFAKYTLVKKE